MVINKDWYDNDGLLKTTILVGTQCVVLHPKQSLLGFIQIKPELHEFGMQNIIVKPSLLYSQETITIRLPCINNSIYDMLVNQKLIVETEYKLNVRLARKIHDRISVNYPDNLDSL